MSGVGSQAYIAVIKQEPTTPLIMPVAPTMQLVAFSDCDLGSEISTQRSKNIKDSRRLQDITLTGVTVGGGFNAEMTYEGSLNDELILSALMVDDWTLDVAKDGKFYQPFYIERGHSDVTEYFQYFGMAVSEWTMKYADQSLVECGFVFMGLSEELSQTPSLNATYTPATDNPVFSTVSDVSDIKIDGTTAGECEVKEWDVTLSNNVVAKTGVGVMGACSTSANVLEVAGNITLYFTSVAMYERLKDGTPFSFEWTVKDATGNGYTFFIPKAKLESDTIPVEGNDSFVMNNATFVGLEDSVEQCVIKVTRIVA